MLAIQRPSMGSSKPPNLDAPFGFTFDNGSSNFPFPSPPAPAPGPSLLDDNESRFLDSFFDGVNSDQFASDFFTTPMDGTGIGFGWEELPPAFMGTTSSLGQPVLSSFDMHDAPFPNDIPSHAQVGTISALQDNPSSDVLAAASVLQNGSNSQSHSLGAGNYFPGPESSLLRANSQTQPYSHSQSHSHSSTNPAIANPAKSPQQHRVDANSLNDAMYTEMVFGRAATNLPPIRPKTANQKIDIRWGSDTSFASQRGFIPERQDSLENIIRPHLQTIKGALNFVTPDSAHDTSPSTPRLGPKSLSAIKAEEDSDSRPSKRRKSRIKVERDEEEEASTSPATRPNTIKKRKPSHRTSSGSPTLSASEPSASTNITNTNGKRRKSSVPGDKKSGRENLTEDQKRENHIRSEQKRRTLIREGFEDLNDLVPGLKGGGFSKSTVLVMAAEWLEELIRGNEVLRNRVREMEGR
ncbi:hypothetical protein B7463_g8332, partial [Scytalidium lignicola]